MAVARNSTATGTSDSSSYNVTIAGSIVIAFFTYDNVKTLATATLNGVSGTILDTLNQSGDGFKVTSVSFVGTFTGSNAVVLTYTGGNPTNSRSKFLGYNNSKFVDAHNALVDTSGTVSTTVVTSGCWVVGFVDVTTGAGAGNPTTGTNNDGYAIAAGTNNGLMRDCSGDSNATVSTGTQSVTTTTTGGFSYAKFIVVLGNTTDSTVSLTAGAFSLTGFTLALQVGIHYTLTLVQGSFSLTGQTLAFILNLYRRFVNQTKNSISPTNKSKSSTASMANQSKHSISPTNQTKSP